MKKITLHAVVTTAVISLVSGAAFAHEDYSEAGVMHWLEHLQSAPRSASTRPVQAVAPQEAPANTAEIHTLKDGSTLYVFSDGKMGMENRFGRVLSMREGQAMETADGRSIVMKGNEVWRARMAHSIHRGG